jgi:hypothetical protein
MNDRRLKRLFSCKKARTRRSVSPNYYFVAFDEQIRSWGVPMIAFFWRISFLSRAVPEATILVLLDVAATAAHSAVVMSALESDYFDNLVIRFAAVTSCSDDFEAMVCGELP